MIPGQTEPDEIFNPSKWQLKKIKQKNSIMRIMIFTLLAVGADIFQNIYIFAANGYLIATGVAQN